MRVANQIVQFNDIGTKFEVIIYDRVYDAITNTFTESILDLTNAISAEIIFKRADGTTMTKTAVIDSGTEGKIHYITVDGDLSLPKTWKLQGRVVFPSGVWSSTVNTFTVSDNLD